ncbi:MAG TPA: tripartite tricarboxylate transporter substrate binding protein [Pseudolabrys sp.]|nr:tripartite tricarboxylate transporter substrate binding protein [Pseudolabrys sp.]
MTMFKTLSACLMFGALALSGQTADAQTPAGKTVRIIVPYPAGGAGDVVTRLLGQEIAEKTGQTIIVENRPGAASMVGSEIAARATPDGTTLLLVENPFVLNPVLYPTHYHPVTSFEPVCFVADTPAVFAVSGTSDIHSFDDFLKAARAQSGKLSYGSTGPASIAHIAGELIKREAKIDMVYVPFPGSPPAVNAVLGGHVTALIANYSDLKAQIESGGLRALAVPAAKRVEPLPNVPTLAELGLKDIEAAVWFGFVAPAQTPKNIVDQFIKDFSAAIQVPEVKRKVIEAGLFPATNCGAPFGKFLQTQFDKYTQFAHEFDIKPADKK